MAKTSIEVPRLGKPALLLTIDTEGDNLWARPRTITTRNSRYLPRFQSLCEKYALRPTYLVNYEMAECPVFCEFGRDVIRRDAGEIGMHLHAWNSPPLVSLTADDMACHPYLIEYPENVVRDKVQFMTELLEDRFARKMLSHRAGRLGFDATYARILAEFGYLVDCSVTPHISWASQKGDPDGAGGPDFTHFPDTPYFLDLNQIDRPGDSRLLEVPVSAINSRLGRAMARASARAPSLVRRGLQRFFPPMHWLVPNGHSQNLDGMLAIVRFARRHRWPCIELLLHSSELMPGGSPCFGDEEAIERLYRYLEILFGAAAGHFRGATLKEFYAAWTADAWAAESRRAHESTELAAGRGWIRSTVAASSDQELPVSALRRVGGLPAAQLLPPPNRVW